VVRTLDGEAFRRGAGDRGGDASRERLVQGVAERLRELREPVVVALQHGRHDVFVSADRAPDRDDEEHQAREAERERSDEEGKRDARLGHRP
jgi:hypothetical protein